MHAQLIDIEMLMTRHIFKPAKVQRQYILDESECEIFHNDLFDAYQARGDRSDYYLGPIILTNPDAKNVVWVYDGQQRLTTLTIYMAILGQLSQGETKRISEDMSQAKIGDLIRPRIDLRTRGGALTRVVRGTIQLGQSTNLPVDWRISQISKMFHTKLNEITDLDDYAAWIRRNIKLNVLWTQSERGLILFDRANNRGVKLQWFELVKSVLIDSLGPTFKAQLNKSIDQFWYESERETRNEFEDLILCTAFCRYGEWDSAQVLAKFEDEFEPSAPVSETQIAETKLSTEQAGGDLFQQLTSHRNTSARLQKLRERNTAQSSEIQTEEQLIEFQLLSLEYPHWKALLMHADRVGTFGMTRLRFLKRLRNYCYTAHLLGWPNWPDRLHYMLYRIRNEMDHNRKFVFSFNHEQIEQARGVLFGTINNRETYRPLIKLWESELAFARGHVNYNKHFLAHVEHILPQAPRNQWCEVFSDENERVELRNKLGNLCLLPKEDNFKLGNDNWRQKQSTYKNLEHCFVGARDAASAEEWAPQNIKIRTQEIASGLTEIIFGHS